MELVLSSKASFDLAAIGPRERGSIRSIAGIWKIELIDNRSGELARHLFPAAHLSA
jgi:hypothetical protein